MKSSVTVQHLENQLKLLQKAERWLQRLLLACKVWPKNQQG